MAVLIKVYKDAAIIAETLHEIEKACFSRPTSTNGFLQSIDTDYYLYFKDGCAAGFLSFKKAADEGYIQNLAVLPEYRKKGIAFSLLKKLLESSKNLKFITLEVRQSNTSAINLYKKLGFSTVGVRKNFYRSPTENADIMTYYIGE